MIITLKVKLFEGEWSAEIEMDDEATLEEVHYAIQEAVGFDDDHLYCFFINRTPRLRTSAMYDDDNGGIYDTTIGELFPLPPKKRLFYLFDFGDEWVFSITKSRKKPHEPVEGVEYPRVVKETGKKPTQYRYDDEE